SLCASRARHSGRDDSASTIPGEIGRLPRRLRPCPPQPGGLRSAPNGWIIGQMAAAAIRVKTRPQPGSEPRAALEAELPQLPPAARVAVLRVLDALISEGAFEPGQIREV